MDLAFPLPQTRADAIVYAAAAVTTLLGLFALFAPRLTLRALRLDTHALYPEAVAEGRSTIGGFQLGVGLMTLMFFDEWTLPLVLGVAWLFAAFGRLVSILADGGSSVYNWLFLLLNFVLAGAPLAAALGFVPG